MKTIGLLGGMSWESTAEYYRLLNQLVAERLGGLHSARTITYSVDFADIEQLQREGRWDEAGAVLADAARRLETAGADLLVLCTNTMHKVADAITAQLDIPLLHIIDTTAAAIQAEGVTDVGLLGTAFTMEQDFYRQRLEQHGLHVRIPERDDRAEIHRIIYEELCRGVILPESRARYVAVIDDLAAQGARGVILGCTEIELLISDADSSVPTFPTTTLHAIAAVGAALS